MNHIIEETRYVMQNAEHVAIDADKIKSLPIYGKQIPSWEQEPHYVGDVNKSLRYVFVLDTLNFCFWNKQNKWTVDYQGKKHSGYRALAASLTRAMDENVPITNPDYLANMQMKDLEYLLRGKGELLLKDERLKGINELGKVLIEKHNGDALHILEKAGYDAQALAYLVANELSSFRDIAIYKKRMIPMLKRAQILAGDIYAATNIKLSGMDRLTIFADYKLPQLFHEYDVLKYSAELENKIMQQIEIPAKSEQEIEIRAATIQACEMIKNEFAKHGRQLAAYQIDWILWLTSKELPLTKPHHLTKTIFY